MAIAALSEMSAMPNDIDLRKAGDTSRPSTLNGKQKAARKAKNKAAKAARKRNR